MASSRFNCNRWRLPVAMSRANCKFSEAQGWGWRLSHRWPLSTIKSSTTSTAAGPATTVVAPSFGAHRPSRWPPHRSDARASKVAPPPGSGPSDCFPNSAAARAPDDPIAQPTRRCVAQSPMPDQSRRACRALASRNQSPPRPPPTSSTIVRSNAYLVLVLVLEAVCQFSTSTADG